LTGFDPRSVAVRKSRPKAADATIAFWTAVAESRRAGRRHRFRLQPSVPKSRPRILKIENLKLPASLTRQSRTRGHHPRPHVRSAPPPRPSSSCRPSSPTRLKSQYQIYTICVGGFASSCGQASLVARLHPASQTDFMKYLERFSVFIRITYRGSVLNLCQPKLPGECRLPASLTQKTPKM
jgi:hypothetical protein